MGAMPASSPPRGSSTSTGPARRGVPTGRSCCTCPGVPGAATSGRCRSPAARTIAASPAATGDPYWSPDGKHVLCFSNRSGSGDLWVVDPQGGEPKALTTWPSEEADGEWAADSKSIYFLSGRFGGAFFDL